MEFRLICRSAAFAAIALGFACESAAQNSEPSFRTKPTSANESLKTFRVLGGFELELVAAEPLIADPVDVAYDEDGRAYVVEMRDYPYPELANAPHEKFLGRVALLEDTDADGRFDLRHDFADEFGWPTSVVCWKGGVFVAAAPDIWYLRDTNGDGKADQRQRVFGGFGRYNVQAIMNNLRWGPDLRIYGAASGNGGAVTGSSTSPDKPISLSGRDFAFSPDTSELVAISGGARFGSSFDDGGERFVCNIRNPVQHVVLPSHYLARNPLLPVRSVVHDVAESGDQLPVFRISPPEAWRMVRAEQWVADRINFPRSELIGAGFWTSSSGVTIYRGDAYPPAYRGNVFVGEVAGNLVHRQILTRDGISFKSVRADQGAEFVSSTDNWFRPVNFANAPDGTLHVLDMYRETIEHPWSIPDEIKGRLDLSSGNDRGRIYRLRPPGYQPRTQPKMSRLTLDELVDLLAHSNAWHHETAQRLLFEQADRLPVARLRKLVQESKEPIARLRALRLLAATKRLAETDTLTALADPDPVVRRHAIEVADAGLASARLAESLEWLAEDSDQRVRLATSFALGNLRPIPVRALAAIARRDSADPWSRTAVLSSSFECADLLLHMFIQNDRFEDRPSGLVLCQELAAMVGSRASGQNVSAVFDNLVSNDQESSLDLQFAVVSGLGRGLTRNGKQLRATLEPESKRVDWLNQLFSVAGRVADDDSAKTSARVQAVELIGLDSSDESIKLLTSLLQSRHPREVQLASLNFLRRAKDDETARVLVANYRQATPAIQNEIVESLLARPNWVVVLIESLESNQIPTSQITIPQRARLGREKDSALAARVTGLFGVNAKEARSEIVARFTPALKLTGNIVNGAAVFRRECAACHRLGEHGKDVGPSLLTVRHRTAGEMVTHIMDPNREVAPQFLTYQALMKDGRMVHGIIVSETDASITIARPDDVRETILRSDIEELSSSGKSLMPEGFEQKLSPQDVADLIKLIKG